MTNEQSRAPRERINITYLPKGDPNAAQVELPLGLMVIGDFGMQGKDYEGDLQERQTARVTKSNFDTTMAGADLSLDLSVPNTLSDGGGRLPVSLKFESMRDFTPDNVLAQIADTRRPGKKEEGPDANREIEDLTKLLQLRNALQSLKGPLSSNKNFRKRLQEVLHDPEQRETLMKEIGLNNKPVGND